MAVFSYQALDHGRSVVSGTVVADTPRQARDTLRARGLMIQQVRALGGSAASTRRLLPQPARWFKRRHIAKVVTFTRELSTLLGAGIPLLEAIDTVAQQHGRVFRTTLLLLRDRVAEGISLADAMRQQPLVFDDLTISIVEVGENAGTLDAVLEQLAQYQEQALQFRNRVLSALLYPAIVFATGIGVSIFLMTFVVPNILTTLLDAGRPLPLMTRIVKTVSDLFLHQWWLLLAALVLLLLALGAALRSSWGRRAWHRLQLKAPVLGPLLTKQAIMRIALVMSTLMRTGITFVRAVQIARATAHNQVIVEALQRCETAVAAGQDIGEALRQTQAFPPLVVQIFAVGQQSGRLEDMLARLAADYDRQVAATTARLTAILEPLLIIALAVIVGCIAFATILPILEAGNVLS